MWKLASYDWIWWTPTYVSWNGDTSNFIAISKASTCMLIFCCDNDNLRCGNFATMYHYLCTSSIIWKFPWMIKHLSLLSNSHELSLVAYLISFISIQHYNCDFDFLNSKLKFVFFSAVIAVQFFMLYFMYQYNFLSCSTVISWTFFISSSLICCAFHTTSATN